jgi:integrase
LPKLHLTDISVRALKAPDTGTITYFDDTTPAFGIRVSCSGRKTWLVMRGKRRIRTRLGSYPDLPLSDARKKAKTLLSEAEHEIGRKPFGSALEQFLDLHGQKLKESSKRQITRCLKRHFAPVYGQRPVGQITRQSIATILDGLMKTPSEAAHAYKDIRTFLHWCVGRGYLQHSPCEGMETPSRYVPRQRTLNDAELKTLWQTAGRIGYPFGTHVKMLILTGQRTGEINSLHFDYIDQDQHTITFPETKNGRIHLVPFGELFLEVLETVPHQEGLLFPGRDKDTPYNGGGKQKWLMDKDLDLAHFTLHDLRRTFATKLAELGVAPHVVERLLNHSSGTISGVAAIYNRFEYRDEMRAAIEAWEKRLRIIVKDEGPDAQRAEVARESVSAS